MRRKVMAQEGWRSGVEAASNRTLACTNIIENMNGTEVA